MELSPASNWMFEGVSVAGLIDFENVSTTVTWDPTFAVPLAGVTEVTVGAVVSAVLATVNVVTTEAVRSEEHTSELQSHSDLVCRLLLEKKKTNAGTYSTRECVGSMRSVFALVAII